MDYGYAPTFFLRTFSPCPAAPARRSDRRPRQKINIMYVEFVLLVYGRFAGIFFIHGDLHYYYISFKKKTEQKSKNIERRKNNMTFDPILASLLFSAGFNGHRRPRFGRGRSNKPKQPKVSLCVWDEVQHLSN